MISRTKRSSFLKDLLDCIIDSSENKMSNKNWMRRANHLQTWNLDLYDAWYKVAFNLKCVHSNWTLQSWSKWLLPELLSGWFYKKLYLTDKLKRERKRKRGAKEIFVRKCVPIYRMNTYLLSFSSVPSSSFFLIW